MKSMDQFAVVEQLPILHKSFPFKIWRLEHNTKFIVKDPIQTGTKWNLQQHILKRDNEKTEGEDYDWRIEGNSSNPVFRTSVLIADYCSRSNAHEIRDANEMTAMSTGVI